MSSLWPSLLGPCRDTVAEASTLAYGESHSDLSEPYPSVLLQREGADGWAPAAVE